MNLLLLLHEAHVRLLTISAFDKSDGNLGEFEGVTVLRRHRRRHTAPPEPGLALLGSARRLLQ